MTPRIIYAAILITAWCCGIVGISTGHKLSHIVIGGVIGFYPILLMLLLTVRHFNKPNDDQSPEDLTMEIERGEFIIDETETTPSDYSESEKISKLTIQKPKTFHQYQIEHELKWKNSYPKTIVANIGGMEVTLNLPSGLSYTDKFDFLSPYIERIVDAN